MQTEEWACEAWRRGGKQRSEWCRGLGRGMAPPGQVRKATFSCSVFSLGAKRGHGGFINRVGYSDLHF